MVLFGKKVGMTHVEQGFFVKPVTVLDISENVVAKISDNKVLVGWGKVKHPTKAQLGQYKDLGFAPALVSESDMEKTDETKVGTLTVAEFPAKVNVHGTSKGKGFAGVVKRHHFHGGPKTHGQSTKHRSAGSIGPGTTPGRVLKDTRMAGHMGNETVTVRNLQVAKVITEEGKSFLVLKGAVPGPKGSIIQLSW